eukprot:CAMPEP_0114556940 /NCGR_PEP_ID=MMETSP0114-20121206/9556_1 /TAXON_ID=31324 /ORGANISM="Goniomonas sp, Strain m" /LENGTH=144 /DNA_ID=CAMNT_0001742177 /DNA_START=17 /DNA_END=451 /DNA_ORIENTATION=-
MPKKGGKGKGKGKKVEAFDESMEACSPFGFFPKDIILTPLGLSVTVVGVKCATPGDPSTARLWAEFNGGWISPLGPKTPEEFATRGYRRAHSARYILRDVAEFEAAQKLKAEEALKKAMEAAGQEEGAPKKDDPKAAKGKGKKK